ncbi:MAG: hypothetical protein H0X25_22880 [Acidobacteriales bacterium]|nr:hypothetical protein [Terriglobales bacterium]
MFKTRRSLFLATTILAAATLAGSTASAQQPTCLPGINTAFQAHAAAYTLVRNALSPRVPVFTALLGQVVDQATYQTLLTASRSLASSIPNGRLLVALPDGTVVVDTSKPDDPTNVLPQGNSYDHYQAKTVNENHNTRVAIMSAQQYPCGFGIESKLSSTTGNVESYVALRLGDQLDSVGTARLSTF